MTLVARFLLLLTGILALAHYAPAGYWLAAAKPRRAPTVFYSCVEQRFLLLRSERGELLRADPGGKSYTREDFERLLPLDNYLQLYKDGRMPKEIRGVAITPEKLRRERVNLRLKPEALDSPGAPLHPLFESQSGRVRLETPADMLRLGAGAEFIEIKSNAVNRAKSEKLRLALAAAEFTFPVSVAGGNPTALKPYDEGLFVADATGSVFHLRQVKGEFELDRLADKAAPEDAARWRALQPRHIHVQEQDNRELRALIIDTAGRAHLLVGPQYRLVTLPFEHYDPSQMALTVRGDMLNRLATASSADRVEALVFDRDYQVVDRYTEALPPATAQPAGRWAKTLFPFTLELASNGSGYLGWHFEAGNPWAWGLNAVCAGGYLVWVRKRPWNRGRALDLAAISLGGWYGLAISAALPGED
jgi:hypothetical protein